MFSLAILLDRFKDYIIGLGVIVATLSAAYLKGKSAGKQEVQLETLKQNEEISNEISSVDKRIDSLSDDDVIKRLRSKYQRD